jgi:hypothetical protein
MRDRTSPWLVAGSIAAAAVSAVLAFRVWLTATRHSLRAASFAWRVATFQLYRRCPDCASRLRSEARVCLRCGYRIKPLR